MYSYISNAAVWQNAASSQNHTSIQNARKVCTFTTVQVSVQAEVRLVTLINMASYARCTHHNFAGVMAASIVWILSWSAAVLCNWLPDTIHFKRPHRWNSSGVKSGEDGGHSTGPPGLIHHPDKKTYLTTGTVQLVQ